MATSPGPEAGDATTLAPFPLGETLQGLLGCALQDQASVCACDWPAWASEGRDRSHQHWPLRKRWTVISDLKLSVKSFVRTQLVSGRMQVTFLVQLGQCLGFFLPSELSIESLIDCHCITKGN